MFQAKFYELLMLNFFWYYAFNRKLSGGCQEKLKSFYSRKSRKLIIHALRRKFRENFPRLFKNIERWEEEKETSSPSSEELRERNDKKSTNIHQESNFQFSKPPNPFFISLDSQMSFWINLICIKNYSFDTLWFFCGFSMSSWVKEQKKIAQFLYTCSCYKIFKSL